MKQLAIAILLCASLLTVSIGPASAGKISARPSVTTGIDGTETMGIIKGGVDRKITTAALGITQNVMAFGAVCDGVTNDAVAIQAAITAAPTNSRIVLPGICGIGAAGLSMTSKTNLTIDGEGKGGIKALAVSSLTPFGASTVVVTTSTNVTFTNMSFDGNTFATNFLTLDQCTECEVSEVKTTSGGVNGVISSIGGIRNQFLNNTVASPVGTARCFWIGNTPTVQLETDDLIQGNTCLSSGGTSFVWTGIGGRIIGNLADTASAGSGFIFAGNPTAGGNNGSQRLLIANNIARNITGHGFQSDQAGAADRAYAVDLVGNIAESNTSVGFYLAKTADSTVTGNIARNNGDRGFQFEVAEHVTVSGNYAYDSRSAGARTQDVGFYAVAATSANDTHDLVFSGNQAYNNVEDGFQLTNAGSGTMSNVTITGNHAHSNSRNGFRVTEAAAGNLSNFTFTGNSAFSNTTQDIRMSMRDVLEANNNFATHLGMGYTTDNTLTDTSATPSVKGRNQWREANTGATTITAFTNGRAGQTITILFTTANTTVTDGGTIFLVGAANFVSTANDTMTLTFDGTNWYETNRSVN